MAEPVILKDGIEEENLETPEVQSELQQEETPEVKSESGNEQELVPISKPGTAPRVPPKPKAETGVEFSVIEPIKKGRPPEFRGLKRAEAQAEVDRVPAPVIYENTDDVLQRLKAGETVELQTDKGTKTITPNAVDFIEEDASLLNALAFEIEEDRLVKEGQVAGPEVAYLSTAGEVDYGRLKKIDDPSKRQSATEYAENRAGLLKMMRPLVDTGDRDIDNMILQYTLDGFETGSAFEALGIRLAEAGRGSVLAIPYLDMYAQSAVDALKMSISRGTSWSEEWAALAPRRERSSNRILDGVDTIIGAPTVARQFNDYIQNRLREDLSEGKISQEEFDYFMYRGTVGDQKIERAFFDDDTAYKMTEFAFTELSGQEQFAVILTENLLGGGIFATTKAAQAGRALKELQGLRKKYNISSSVKLQNIPAFVRMHNSKVKFDDSLLKIGFLNRRFQKDSFRAAGRQAEVKKLMDATPIDQRNTNKYRMLKSEYDNLGRLRRRNWLKTKVSPFVTDIAGAEVVIATTAYAGQALLPGAAGMSRDMAEITGLLGGLIFHKPIGKAAKTTVGATTGLGVSLTSSLAFGGELRNPVPIALRKLMQMDTTVDDYDLNVFAPANNGKRMSIAERRGVKRVFKFIDEMSFEDRQAMLETIQQHDNMRQRIINAFPEGEPRSKAEQLFNATFAEATAIAPLISMTQEAASSLSLKQLKKMGLSDINELYGQILASRERMSFALKNFEEHAVEFASPGSKEAMKTLVSQSKKSFELMDQQIEAEFSGMQVALNNLLDIAAADPDTPLSPRFLQEITSLKQTVEKRVGLAGDVPEGSQLAVSGEAVTDAAQEIIDNRSSIEQLNDGLNFRLDAVKASRDDAVRYGLRLDGAAEAVLLSRNETLMNEVEQSYVPFRNFIKERGANNPRIDLSNMVDRMIDILSTDGSIDQVFGSGAVFFGGFMGKRTRLVFEKMARSSLNNLKESGEFDTAIVEIAEASQGRLNVTDLVDMMESDVVSFSLILHKAGKLNMFSEANIDEVDVMVRSFSTYANRTTNQKIKDETYRFKNLAEEAMKNADEEGYEMLEIARQNMTAANDPKRKGTILHKLMKSYLGESVDPVALGPYEGMYSDITPGDIFRKPAEALSRAMNAGGNKTKSISEIRGEMNRMAELFGNYIDESGQLVIDLRTDEGKKSFQLLQKITTEYLYDSWATGALKKRDATLRGNIAARFDFRASVQDELGEFQEAFQVRVVDESGETVEVNAVDLQKILVDENDIIEKTRIGGELEKAGKRASLDLRINIRNAQKDSDLLRKVEDKQNRVLFDIAGISTDAQFYTEYVNGFKDIDDLKDQFVQAMRRDTSFFEEVGQEGVEKMFDEAVFSMTYRALSEIGGRSAIGTVRKGLEGVDEYVQIDFANKVGLLAELTENRESLTKIFTEKQLENLIDITAYCVNQEAMNIGLRMAGNQKKGGMSMNEALSRAYNIARGMVSPTYVASEVTIRILEKTGSDSFLLAMQNPDAAEIMSKMMRFPSQVTKLELDTYDTLLREFMAVQLVREGQEEIAMSFLEENYGMPIEDDEVFSGSGGMPRRGVDPSNLVSPQVP